jgi:ATP-dependent protease HslVU (ClpYQ) peptidase subunit
MSVVAVRILDDKICMAADSRVANGDAIRPGIEFEKIRKIGGVVIGTVGTCQEIQLLYSYLIENKLPADDLKLVKYMAAFYKWRNEINSKLEPENKEIFSEGEYLFVVNRTVYCVSNLFVGTVTSYHAMGSGECYAMGALATGASVVKAAEIACMFNSGCGMPVQYMEVKR